MAADKGDKKRKTLSASAAPSQDPPSKKSKKAKPTKAQNESPKPAKGNTLPQGGVKINPDNVDEAPSREVKPRKRVADFFGDGEAVTKEDTPEKKKSKNGSNATPKPEPAKAGKEDAEEVAVEAQKKPKNAEPPAKESKKASKEKQVSEAPPGEQKKQKKWTSQEESKKADEESAKEAPTEEREDESAEESEEDDQTEALLQGFESSDDENKTSGESFPIGEVVPRIPDSKQVKRQLKQKKANKEVKEEPGTVYVGRIPHGFYESEMRAYFSQFGDIINLRLSRNRTTGRSKHYAFIQFASESVAKIVSKTMDNYLMFGHILKCKFVPKEKVHAALWKGANRRFKRTPWRKIEKRRLEAGKTREQWTDKIEKVQKERNAKAEKMKALGYEYEVPKIKGVEEVPVQKPAVEGKEEPKALEASEPNVEQAEKGAPDADKVESTPVKKAAEQGDEKERATPQATGKKAKKGKATPDSMAKKQKETPTPDAGKNTKTTPAVSDSIPTETQEISTPDTGKKAKKAKATPEKANTPDAGAGKKQMETPTSGKNEKKTKTPPTSEKSQEKGPVKERQPTPTGAGKAVKTKKKSKAQ